MLRNDIMSKSTPASEAFLRQALRRGACILLLTFATGGFATEAVRRSFDIPADAAEKSLRRFSAQSGVQVIFPTEVVRDVQTRAIKGWFTNREALERMIAGTVLKVVHDEKTGALTVARRRP